MQAMFFLLCICAAVGAAGIGPIFELDMYVNDLNEGYQPTGYPEYLQTSAATYTNVAGISFIQPENLMNSSYVLPTPVGNAVSALRKQGVTVQILVGGQMSRGWKELQANPSEAAKNAIRLMHQYDCGMEIDNESGGDSAGLVEFIKMCAAGKPSGTYISMDVDGTPTKPQKETIKGAIDHLDWVNAMVSTPQYNQSNSAVILHKDGVPYNKMTIAYYAGTWVHNCNTIGSASNNGDTAAGINIVKDLGLKGLSVWAVGGASYAGCGTTSAPGFAQALKMLGAKK